MREKDLLDAGYRRLRDTLGEGSGFELLQLPVKRSTADAVWAVKSVAGEARLVVEAKTAIWPRDVKRIAAQLRVCGADEQADRCLVVAPSLTKRTRELLRSCDIDYVAVRGEVRVMIPGRLLIVASGAKNGSADEKSYDRKRIANPFRGKASRVVRALLAEPERWWGVTELAERVEVSAGLAVKTLNGLEDEAYVRRNEDRKVRASDGEALLRRWADATKNAFRDAKRFTSKIRDPDELTTELSEGLERLGVGYAITRLAAARFVEPYAPASVVDAYVDGDPDLGASALDFLPVDRGESLRLVTPPDAGVFQFTQQQSGITIVNPVQLFVDLKQGGGREPDVAERLFETRLRQDLSPRSEP